MSDAPDTVAAFRAPWRRLMVARDPAQSHRASTPLELLFDLCFVVAVSQAAAQLAHAVEADHIGSALLGYVLIFFAIWWAWVNFTWFASAYDTDDVPYRLLTLVQMAGVLILAAGVPAAFNDYDFRVLTAGYVVMRVPMILQWLRAALEHPAGRPAALRYAACIAVVQVLWVARLALPLGWGIVAFAVLAVAEMAIPAYAELGRATSWHPEHIAERYGLLTLIVLGECVLGTTVAFQRGITEQGVSVDLVLLAVGGLLLIFGLWWIYFLGGDHVGLVSQRIALIWGYGHYLVFAAIAALGGGLEVAVAASEHEAHIPPAVAGLAVAVPVAVFLIVISVLRRYTWPAGSLSPILVSVLAVVVLGCGALAGVIGMGTAVLVMGVAVGTLLAAYLRRAARRARQAR